jgi:histidine phosphotransferase ChpT
MSVQMDMKITELLCSRLCHDLISPVGAVNNGVELLQDYDPSMADEILPLIVDSAKRAWRRLEFFRVAFGFGGGQTSRGLADLRGLAVGMLEGEKVELDWPPAAPGDNRAIEGRAAKLLLNLIVLGAEALPRGGTLKVESSSNKGDLGLSIAATGEGVRITDIIKASREGQVEIQDRDARNVRYNQGVARWPS